MTGQPGRARPRAARATRAAGRLVFRGQWQRRGPLRVAAHRDAAAPGNLAPRFLTCQARSILFRPVTVCSLHCSPLSDLIGACITCRYPEEQIGVSVMA